MAGPGATRRPDPPVRRDAARDKAAVPQRRRQRLGGAVDPLPPQIFHHSTPEGGRYAAGDRGVADAGTGVVGPAAAPTGAPLPGTQAHGGVLVVAAGFVAATGSDEGCCMWTQGDGS